MCDLLPFQAKDAIENGVLSVSFLQGKHTAEDIKVELVVWDRTQNSGFQEGGPPSLQGPLATPVSLQTEEMGNGWMC